MENNARKRIIFWGTKKGLVHGKNSFHLKKLIPSNMRIFSGNESWDASSWIKKLNEDFLENIRNKYNYLKKYNNNRGGIVNEY